MRLLLMGGQVFADGALCTRDVLIDGGVIASVRPGISPQKADRVIDCHDLFIVPGFVDVHVHLREPGFFMKETIASGTAAAARGGYTQVCAMPNLDPVPDCPAHLRAQLDLIGRDAAVRVAPYGAITTGEKGQTLADFEALSPHVVGFSDDGRGVQSDEMMREAMRRIEKTGRAIAAHCEVDALLRGGYIHEGQYAAAHGHAGIPSESEWAMVKRDLGLVRETGCRYHICHISAKESVALLRAAKAEGLPVSGETAPHYLALTDMDLQDHGRFKMNPPIRSAADRDALIEGLQDGTIEVIATDHAPHTAAEKAGGLRGSLNGIVGLETAFPVLYTELVRSGLLTLPQLIDRMCVAPRRLFHLPGGRVAAGEAADLAVLDLRREYAIDPAEFLSKGRSTPFEGRRVRGEAVLTLVNGGVAWEKK